MTEYLINGLFVGLTMKKAMARARQRAMDGEFCNLSAKMDDGKIVKLGKYEPHEVGHLVFRRETGSPKEIIPCCSATPELPKTKHYGKRI